MTTVGTFWTQKDGRCAQLDQGHPYRTRVRTLSDSLGVLIEFGYIAHGEIKALLPLGGKWLSLCGTHEAVSSQDSNALRRAGSGERVGKSCWPMPPIRGFDWSSESDSPIRRWIRSVSFSSCFMASGALSWAIPSDCFRIELIGWNQPVVTFFRHLDLVGL